MTIGIAAHGPNAGLAIFRALAAAERVASGSIGGFAAFAAIAANGDVYRAETQRGGTATLFVSGETTGLEPPDRIARAPSAALMSSGPDRPLPLSQYVAMEQGAGLVTGHRLPNADGSNGRAVNIEVLDRLREGLSARQAVIEVLDMNPEADAGMIAIDLHGAVYGQNSERVTRRPDLGHARREDEHIGAVIEVLHNAISPVASIAALAADIGLSVMAPQSAADGEITVSAGLPITVGSENRVFVDENGEALRVESTDSRIVSGTHNCAAIYLGSNILLGDRLIGRTLFEPNAVVRDGRIISYNGLDRMLIAYRSGAAD